MTQPLEALEIAKRRRVDRARVRSEIARPGKPESRARCAVVLEDPPECVQTAFVCVVVGWCWRMAQWEADALVRGLGIGLYRTVGELTARQRGLVADAVRGRKTGRVAA